MFIQITTDWGTIDRPNLSSERMPHRDKKEISWQKTLDVWSEAHSVLDTKTYWLSDRRNVTLLCWCPKKGAVNFCWAQISMFHLKTDTESSLRNVVL
jgi:hypothetical protein